MTCLPPPLKVLVIGKILAIDPLLITIDRDAPGFAGYRQLPWTIIRAAVDVLSIDGGIAVLNVSTGLFEYACRDDLAHATPGGRA